MEDPTFRERERGRERELNGGPHSSLRERGRNEEGETYYTTVETFVCDCDLGVT